jgi:hypothetical protein
MEKVLAGNNGSLKKERITMRILTIWVAAIIFVFYFDPRSTGWTAEESVLKDRNAKAAMKRLKAKVKEIEEDREKKLKEAAEDCAKDLKKAIKGVTIRGDLDEAIVIRSIVEQLENDELDLASLSDLKPIGGAADAEEKGDDGKPNLKKKPTSVVLLMPTNMAEVGKMQSGRGYLKNRPHRFVAMPEEFRGLRFLRLPERADVPYKLASRKGGLVFLIADPRYDQSKLLLEQGWHRCEELKVTSSHALRKNLLVFARTLKKKDVVGIPGGQELTPMVVAREIEIVMEEKQ